MSNYEQNALKELILWKEKMKKEPSISSDGSKGLQNKMNNLVPDKVENLMSDAIKKRVKINFTLSRCML